MAAATGPGTVIEFPIQRETLARSVPSASAQRDCQPRSGPNSLIASFRNCSAVIHFVLLDESKTPPKTPVVMCPAAVTDTALGRRDVDHIGAPGNRIRHAV